jgi:HEAT repeat protein
MLLAAPEDEMRHALLLCLAFAQSALAADDATRQQVLGLLGGYEETASPDSLKALDGDVPGTLRAIASDTTLPSTQRARAIHALGWFPDDTNRAFLVVHARGGDPMFARKAVYALANGWGDKAIDELTVALANPDVQTRMAAANALGRMGTPSAKLTLEARLVHETDPTVKANIETQMGR